MWKTTNVICPFFTESRKPIWCRDRNVGDKSPGQATGNGKNLSGGLWWEMTVSGSTPPANAGATSKASSGGGGYGY